ITKLHQRLQTTFIYVTHDQTEAMTMGSRIVIMKDGFIQQVDTPQNNYDYPNNKFVAGFIGSPQMNFFDVTLKNEGGRIVAVFGNNTIEVPKEKVDKLKDESYIGKEVTMGIRPEDIDDDPEFVAAHPNATMKVHVEVTELMGSETYLYFNTDGKDDNIIARVDPRTKTRADDDVLVAMDTTRLHFFDKDTEETILSR
ncbi:MAG: ABC transporter ATP-binding protein, partial [Clostridia bacterium]|nr:ABC transporter ATP-binding protein [Clostridia bacterium]